MFLMRLLVGKGRGAGFLLPQPRLKSYAHRGPGPGSPGVAPDIVSPALPLVNLEIWRWWSHSGADHWPLITIMRQGDGSVRTGVSSRATQHSPPTCHVTPDKSLISCSAGVFQLICQSVFMRALSLYQWFHQEEGSDAPPRASRH